MEGSLWLSAVSWDTKHKQLLQRSLALSIRHCKITTEKCTDDEEGRSREGCCSGKHVETDRGSYKD